MASSPPPGSPSPRPPGGGSPFGLGFGTAAASAGSGSRRTARLAPSTLSLFTTLSQAMDVRSFVAAAARTPVPGAAPSPWARLSQDSTPFSPHFLLVPTALLGAFGPGFQEVPVLLFAFYPCVLLYSHTTSARSIPLLLIAAASGSFAANFALLNDPSPTVAGVLVSLLFACSSVLATLPAALVLDRLAVWRFFQTSWFASLSFPAALTFCWTLWSAVQPFGALGSPGPAARMSELAHAASLLGPEARGFLAAWAGT
ncbi:hypothetical protein HK405_002188, partial [Cladochytrium tenue]